MGKDYSHHVVILGGGFGGLYAAKALGQAAVKVTLVDKRNFHLFQPLLYQVATGGLSPGDITYPLRVVLNRYKNIWVYHGEVIDIDPDQRKVILREGEISYDTLIVATGASHHYFGHDEWAQAAPGLKTVEDALELRRRILLAYETAEWQPDPEKRRAWMTFVVVGGGPTGVESAGAIGELAHSTLKNDFRNINPADASILLLEGMERILPTFPPDLAGKAEAALKRLGITVHTRALVTDIQDSTVCLTRGEQAEQIQAKTVLWAAGIKASPLGQVLARRAGSPLDHAGRVIVEPDLSLKGYPNIFMIGDLANFAHQDDKPLPSVAPVAMQQGDYVAKLIERRLEGKTLPRFHYRDKGSLAVIGRNAAVADLGRFHFSGFIAWLVWAFVHIRFLIEFENQLLVLLQWGWNYFTRKRGARLITGQGPVEV
jgi:NADH:quinone reductase (non-electrogenic)